ncbi:calcium-binding and coiled-coil domain-containing protein 1-like [Anneissia japonica]|uniref:calcium-binding and coiled-coil domain-containing protein 1-like n=1 Tax=Anneissia japonica TaxID=1529436 RepID=UPI00142555B9|nr:calcium-binding and coiled-coil domain-containing protein 1-like [Anneissia japonica]
MPPKKGKGKKKAKNAEPEGEPDKPAQATEKEILLKQELDSLTEELAGLKKRVDELRRENEWLQEEAHKTRVESHEYMSYMSKKAHKRQTTIITLSDQNQEEIRQINLQKEAMLMDYEAKKKVLRDELMEKDSELAKTNKELQELDEYKQLQEDQVKRIRDLEKEVMRMRGKHTDTIQKLKSKFLAEKREFQQESDGKIQQVAQQANREALICLQDHTNKIKQENRELRHELLKLIRRSRALQEHKADLEEQKRQLLCEKQYADDLKRLRTTRQHQVLTSFGLIDKENNLKQETQ